MKTQLRMVDPPKMINIAQATIDSVDEVVLVIGGQEYTFNVVGAPTPDVVVSETTRKRKSKASPLQWSKGGRKRMLDAIRKSAKSQGRTIKELSESAGVTANYFYGLANATRVSTGAIKALDAIGIDAEKVC